MKIDKLLLVNLIISIVFCLFLIVICFIDATMLFNPKLLVTSILVFSLPIIIQFYIFELGKEQKSNKTILKVISGICIFFLLPYLLIIMVVLDGMSKPITNYKAYNMVREKEFPKSIPGDAKNIYFNYEHIYIYNKMEMSFETSLKTINKYESKFRKNAKQIITYDGKEPSYIVEADEEGEISYDKDSVIYLFEDYCNGPGYCNHGKYSYIKINKKTCKWYLGYSEW